MAVMLGGSAIPWLGSDGIADDPYWIGQAGSAAVNTSGTVPVPEITALTSATDFISSYKAMFGSDPLPYSAMAYDAANIEIQAMTAVITAGKPVTRANVCAAVQAVSYTGVIGNFTFDTNGDNSGTKYFSFWAVFVDETWHFVRNEPTT